MSRQETVYLGIAIRDHYPLHSATTNHSDGSSNSNNHKNKCDGKLAMGCVVNYNCIGIIIIIIAYFTLANMKKEERTAYVVLWAITYDWAFHVTSLCTYPRYRQLILLGLGSTSSAIDECMV